MVTDCSFKFLKSLFAGLDQDLKTITTESLTSIKDKGLDWESLILEVFHSFHVKSLAIGKIEEVQILKLCYVLKNSVVYSKIAA